MGLSSTPSERHPSVRHSNGLIRRANDATKAPLPLRLGDSGDAVLDMQQRLTLAGFPTGGELREFGELTEVSVRNFQKARGLLVDGICGAITWSSLIEAAHRLGDRLLYYRSPMMRGDDIEDLQRRLGRLGFDARWIDGIFGPSTQAATRQFQQNVGLPADGVVGRSTVVALDRLTSTSTERITIAAVRERERLLYQPSVVRGRRIVLGDTGQVPVVVQSLARRLRRSGAQVLALSTPEMSHHARVSNRWSGDVYLGVTLADDNLSVSYLATDGFESIGGRALAHYCRDQLQQLFAKDVPATAMRLPILRETQMPAVWCRIGPGSLVVTHAPQIAECFTEALTRWCQDPFPSRGAKSVSVSETSSDS